MIHLYKDKRGEFRWRVTARNGQVTGASSEGFARYRSCRSNAPDVRALPWKWQRGSRNWTAAKGFY